MADDGFNGSTVDFASVTLGPLRSLNFRDTAARVPVHGSASSSTEYETGIPDPELTVQFVGGLPSASCEIGSSGGLVIAWEDGGVDGSMTTVKVADRQTDGNMDGEILSSITVVPTPAT